MDARACAREQRQPQLTLRRPRGARCARPAAAALQLARGSEPLVTFAPRGREGVFPGSLGTGERAARREEAAGAGTLAVRVPPEGSASATLRAGPTREPGPGSCPAGGPRASSPRRQVRAHGAAHPADAPRLHLLPPGLSIPRLGFQCARGWAAAVRRPLHAPERGLCQGSQRLRRPGWRGGAGGSGGGGREGGGRFQGGGAGRVWGRPSPSPQPGPSPRRPPAAPPGPTAARPGARPLSPQRALAAFELLTFCQLPSDERNENKYFFSLGSGYSRSQHKRRGEGQPTWGWGGVGWGELLPLSVCTKVLCIC